MWAGGREGETQSWEADYKVVSADLLVLIIFHSVHRGNAYPDPENRVVCQRRLAASEDNQPQCLAALFESDNIEIRQADYNPCQKVCVHRPLSKQISRRVATTPLFLPPTIICHGSQFQSFWH